MVRKILIVVYLVVGFVVANSHHFFKHLNAVKPVISAVLGVVLWPAVLFGANLHIK
jgi:cell shape-determining protein MreC